MSVYTSRNSLFITLKSIEKENLGVFITSPLIEEIVQKLAIAFVKYNGFESDRKKCVEKMTKVLKRCTQLHNATAGNFQFDKTYFFSWRWKRDNGKFKVKNIECSLEVNKTGIIQLKVKEAIRTVGVQMCPKLQ